jgi:hypothetical protein
VNGPISADVLDGCRFHLESPITAPDRETLVVDGELLVDIVRPHDDHVAVRRGVDGRLNLGEVGSGPPDEPSFRCGHRQKDEKSTSGEQPAREALHRCSPSRPTRDAPRANQRRDGRVASWGQ